jgi:hypothetical protein
MGLLDDAQLAKGLEGPDAPSLLLLLLLCASLVGSRRLLNGSRSDSQQSRGLTGCNCSLLGIVCGL